MHMDLSKNKLHVILISMDNTWAWLGHHHGFAPENKMLKKDET